MALALRCDRCGKYYNVKKALLTNSEYHEILGVGRMRTDNGLTFYTKTYDICEDCMIEFNKFIGESEDKNEMET